MIFFLANNQFLLHIHTFYSSFIGHNLFQFYIEIVHLFIIMYSSVFYNNVKYLKCGGFCNKRKYFIFQSINKPNIKNWELHLTMKSFAFQSSPAPHGQGRKCFAFTPDGATFLCGLVRSAPSFLNLVVFILSSFYCCPATAGAATAP